MLAFLILVGFDGDLVFTRKLMIFGTAFLFASIVPFVHVVWLKQRGAVRTMDIEHRQRRLWPLLVGIISYSVAFVLLHLMQAPGIIRGLMFCYATNTLVVMLITFIWKISIHAMGIAGPITAMIFRFGWPAVPFYVLVLLIANARVVLGKHTIGQVVAGASIGTFLTAIQLHFLFLT